ncbi:MAG: hypothetical protein ABI664_03995 [bacterium]
MPRSAFDDFADQLLMCLSPALPDEFAAERLALFEAKLGLRDSPLPHRLSVIALIRAAITKPAT